jgi:hypothetical protein
MVIVGVANPQSQEPVAVERYLNDKYRSSLLPTSAPASPA